MISNSEMLNEFKKHQAQTHPNPLGLIIKKAKGNYIYDIDGKEYLDWVAGVSATPLGHNNSKVNRAIRKQIKKYTHVMVYGEFVQKYPLALSKKLIETLPISLNSVYLTNSGTEAIEGALKLAKRVTGRIEIISTHNSYHGNTLGSMSISHLNENTDKFRPLLPMINRINFNDISSLDKITTSTAAVVLETIQGSGGFYVEENNFLSRVKQRCIEVGALLILDEIQTGIGRLGTFWGFEKFNVEPDILVCGKGLANGLPIGAFISNKSRMDSLTNNPTLGHITTFGGNSVVASAAYTCVTEILKKKLIYQVKDKEIFLRKKLKHPLIIKINGTGLMLALIMKDERIADLLIQKVLKKGLILFYLLFEKKAVRITPPLTISFEELEKGCSIIVKELDELKGS